LSPNLIISTLAQLILDEADTLLDMGFRDDIEDIIRHLPPVPERQTLMFSATIKREIRDIARTTLDANYQYINCVDENESPVHAHIPQYHTVLSGANKQFQHIVRLVALDQLRNPGASKIIIFLPTTKMTELVSDIFRQVSRQALPAAGNTRIYEIHSKRSQQQRTAASDTFRQDKNGASILITSDVSARGVDYPGVTNVIQMGIPGSPDQYVHRVGRTGRAGTGGRCDLVLLPWESGFLRWQLANVPIKPVTEAEITTQLQTLAEQYDQDPSKFESQVPKTRTGRGLFQGPMVTRTINDTETVLESSIPNIDHSQASEAFTSLLGYYMGKSAELRAERAAIVEGVRNWAIGAMMMEKPPYVSEQFLQRLGFSERGSGHWNRSGGARSVSDRSAPWLGRGRQSTRSEPFGRSRGESDSAEYPGSRYGRASQSLSLSGRDSQRSNDFGGGFTPSSRQERYPTRTSGSYARRTGDDEHPSRFEGLYSRRGDNRSSEGRRLTPKTWDD
jgi:ATP-dependent RNA helicase MSS116